MFYRKKKKEQNRNKRSTGSRWRKKPTGDHISPG